MTNYFSKLVVEDTEETTSKNPGRRDKKKLSRLLEKENKSKEDLQKIETLRTKLNVYDFGSEENIKKRDEGKQIHKNKEKARRKKKEKEIKKKEEAQKKIEEELKRKQEEEIQKRKREDEIQQKKREEVRIREEEESKKKWEEKWKKKCEEERKRNERKEEAEKKSLTVSCIEEELQELNVNIPNDITTFINKPYDKKEYYKLARKYHPDKKKYKEEVITLFTQLINNHRPALDIKNDESWQK